MLLAAEDAALFYRVWGALLAWVNDRRNVVPRFRHPTPDHPIAPDLARQIRDVLWADDSLRQQYLAEAGHTLAAAERDLIASWQHRVQGQFVIYNHMKQHSIFMGDEVYGVHGIFTPLDVMFPSVPNFVGAVLLPFRDVVITDGLMTSPPMQMSFGPGIRRMFKNQYSRAREEGQIRTRLPWLPGSEPTAPRMPHGKPRRIERPQLDTAELGDGQLRSLEVGGNSYCTQLDIAVPSLEAVLAHPEANTYALLIVALLEHGAAMTLADVATRFAEAGVVPHVDDAYFSLKRCRPARPPVYRDGDLYGLDPYDAELDLWAFRLGLRPARVQRPAQAPAAPRAPASQALTLAELQEAWGNNASLNGWSAQRIALAILDAHGRSMQPAEVVAFVSACTKWHRLVAGPDTFRRTGAVAIDTDGAWSIVSGAPELFMARDTVRDALERVRRNPRTPPALIEEARRAYEQRQAAHVAELARMRRVIVHGFPRQQTPRVVVLVDAERRELVTLEGDELARIDHHLAAYDVLTGVDIRGMLRALGIDARDRRLAELGPSQKSIIASSSGRTLKITTAMLIQGSCGISRPLGEDKQLRGYLAKGELAKLRARLEADAKALYALHQYGRLHGAVRLRRGALDEMFKAPWHHHDEPTLYHLRKEARDLDMGLIAVVGAAPAWDNPWARAQRLEVEQGNSEYDLVLFDEWGRYIDDRDVQLARLEAEIN